MIIAHIITRHMRDFVRYSSSSLVAAFPKASANGFYLHKEEVQA